MQDSVTPSSPGAPPPRARVGATELARALGASRPFVYRHADELGGVRLDGDTLLFDFEEARAALASIASQPATVRAAAIAERQARVAERYRDGSEQCAIALEFGCSTATVSNDLDALEAAGRIERRPPGEAISKGVLAYRQTEAGHKRTDEQRYASRVQRQCKWCGRLFEVYESYARKWPARFCSDQCAADAAWRGPGATDRREAASENLTRGRAKRSRRKQEGGLLFLYEVQAALPPELRCGRKAMLSDIRAGGLIRTDALGRSLVTPNDAASYEAWRRGQLEALSVARKRGLMDRGEGAQRLGSMMRLYHLVDTGELKPVFVNGHPFYSDEDIRRCRRLISQRVTQVDNALARGERVADVRCLRTWQALNEDYVIKRDHRYIVRLTTKAVGIRQTGAEKLRRENVREQRKLLLSGPPTKDELREELSAIASEVIDHHRELDDLSSLSLTSFLAEIGLVAWQRALDDFRQRYPAGRGARDDPDSPAQEWRKPIADRVRGLIGEDAKALLDAAK